ncbi:hypothetical protein LCGC14_1508270 [marine sediment metagenome]|uniref:Uncharacterized protein n=1 Tax=marine sediment metagenome TaxID=412755 RepID=A0A0F9JMU5_9ZZZZ
MAKNCNRNLLYLREERQTEEELVFQCVDCKQFYSIPFVFDPNNLEGFKKKQSKYAYGITISSYYPFKSESFLDSRIAFQPAGKTDIDVPLLISKAPEILKETMELLFDISIQEANPQLFASFYGSCYFESESSNKIKIDFRLKALLGDSNRDYFFVELPE